ncbi:MAG: hypothetical protein BWY15_00836 [Firmicutes bacterium ADurb.Bin193]|nr:MAG: hypothetical protein BWY15_00836 [Firmicutes bacterium ADurb.Bin193]
MKRSQTYRSLCGLIAIILVIGLVSSFGTIASAQAEMKIEANGNIKVSIDNIEHTFDPPPILVNDRTMVPMRAVFEALGATVEWDEATSTAIAVRGTVTMKIKIGAPAVYVGAHLRVIDPPAMIYKDRTMVPLRFISEWFGFYVDWLPDTNTVVILSDAVPHPSKTPVPTKAPTGPQELTTKYPLTTPTVSGPGKNGVLPEHMIDGDVATSWALEKLDCTIIFDLGEKKPINAVTIIFGGSAVRTQWFELYGSNDGTKYEKIGSFESQHALNIKELYSFDNKEYQYIKVLNKGNTRNTYINIVEMEIGTI